MSPPRATDPRGGGLTAVSCAPGGFCVATDFDGRTVAFGAVALAAQALKGQQAAPVGAVRPGR
ncbi:MAG TPA: hypothetical protein VK817_23395 [Trebonia sp.]|nr:hypothetical protein [Trebonia sp.]